MPLRADLRAHVAQLLRDNLSIEWGGAPLVVLVTESRGQPLDTKSHKVAFDVSIGDVMADGLFEKPDAWGVGHTYQLFVSFIYKQDATSDEGALMAEDDGLVALRVDDLVHAIEHVVVNGQGIGRRAGGSPLQSVRGFTKAKYETLVSRRDAQLLGEARLAFDFADTEEHETIGDLGTITKVRLTDTMADRVAATEVDLVP